jgi:ribosomal protein S18 acetylase RimI-like enzyme
VLEWSTREALPSDVEFAFAVTESAMRGYVERTWGSWEPQVQRERHQESFVPSTHRVVLANGRQVGIVAVDILPSHLQLEKLYLLPEVRNQGVGAQVLGQVLAQARDKAMPVQLRVLRVNTLAQRFYVRHGFVVTEATPERLFMATGT